MSYGKELILDLYGCDVEKFNRQSIKDWIDELCKLINMEQEALYFWDFEGVPEEEIPYDQPHLVGTSGVNVLTTVKTHGAIQFISTSDIVIHTLDMVGECYINIFSCKDFDCMDAEKFTRDWFGATKSDLRILARGKGSKV